MCSAYQAGADVAREHSTSWFSVVYSVYRSKAIKTYAKVPSKKKIRTCRETGAKRPRTASGVATAACERARKRSKRNQTKQRAVGANGREAQKTVVRCKLACECARVRDTTEYVKKRHRNQQCELTRNSGRKRCVLHMGTHDVWTGCHLILQQDAVKSRCSRHWCDQSALISVQV